MTYNQSGPAFYSGLGAEERWHLERLRTPWEAAAGSLLFRERTPASSIFLIRSGVALVQKKLPDGRRQVIGFLYPGDLLGLTMGECYVFGAEAVTNLSLWELHRAGLDELLSRIPKLERRLLELTAHELIVAQNRMLTLGRRNATERMACFLLELAERNISNGKPASPVWVPMDRSMIADYLGIRVETASRTLGWLRAEGLISDSAFRNRITLPDLERLASYTQGA